jgi:hypothetical protein
MACHRRRGNRCALLVRRRVGSCSPPHAACSHGASFVGGCCRVRRGHAATNRGARHWSRCGNLPQVCHPEWLWRLLQRSRSQRRRLAIMKRQHLHFTSAPVTQQPCSRTLQRQPTLHGADARRRGTSPVPRQQCAVNLNRAHDSSAAAAASRHGGRSAAAAART